MADKILGGLLWAGVAYFCCMAAAHFVGFKMPLLFIYYDAPFYAYQDKIIAFAVVAYICLFYSAARIPDVVPAALAALWITVIGLCLVNLSDALRIVLAGKGTTAYWLQTALLGVYTLTLTLCWRRAKSQPAT
ncbi:MULTISPECIES: hypothetical protein [unclassified Bradyrhizobium]|uniref:hypothetical protein n=1 Tax=unclassified Bradyrhizobium TaxID=2631580 RepID=UPI002FF22E69